MTTETSKQKFMKRLIELYGVSEEYADAAYYTMLNYSAEWPNLAAASYGHRFNLERVSDEQG